MLARERQLALVALAARAPSPHNIQPARWRFDGDTVELWEDTARWLAVGDPTGRDNRIALGMAWEGMAIALSNQDLALQLDTSIALDYPPPKLGHRRAACGVLRKIAARDALLPALERRASYRSRFAQARSSQLETLDSCIVEHASLAIALPATAPALVALWQDLATVEGLKESVFTRELHHWMRFSSRDPRWGRDGLSTDCLALSKFEAWSAALVLRPAVMKILSALSLTRFFVSEAEEVKSAARISLIHQPAGGDAFATGRAWYRFWLALDLIDMGGVPMSALNDSHAYAHKLLAAYPLPAGRELVNVMRLGPKPAGMIARSARLPADELLLDR
jgi:hypothetical protein